MASTPDIFDKARLPPARRLEARVAPAIVLRGARQVGKTTLQEQTIDFLLRERKIDPRRIFRVQFDELPVLRGLEDPILEIVRWYQNRILGRTLNQAAHAGEPAYIFLDEVQNLRDWAPQLKTLVDLHTVQIVVTGSSALRIEAGRDSLAGRITSLELGTFLLREIAGLRLGERIEPLLPPNGPEPLLEMDFWRQIHAHGIATRAIAPLPSSPSAVAIRSSTLGPRQPGASSPSSSTRP